jgi:phosphoglycolate phosphatase
LLALGIAAFRHHYAGFNGCAAAEYPGVREGLEAFRALGLPLGVVTNKPAAFTGPLLERTGLADFFVVSVSGDTTANKKPHPEPILHACAILGVRPEENLHIGDSDNDLIAARAAGCQAFAVPYGYNEEGGAGAFAADVLVRDLADAARRVAEINRLLLVSPV